VWKWSKFRILYPEGKKRRVQSEWERAGSFHAKERNTDQREVTKRREKIECVVFRGL